MATKNIKGDVWWYRPHTKFSKDKKPIAYSTRAVSDLIVVLSRENETIYDVYNAINYDEEAKEILQKYIDLGFGNEVASNLFK